MLPLKLEGEVSFDISAQVSYVECMPRSLALLLALTVLGVGLGLFLQQRSQAPASPAAAGTVPPSEVRKAPVPAPAPGSATVKTSPGGGPQLPTEPPPKLEEAADAMKALTPPPASGVPSPASTPPGEDPSRKVLEEQIAYLEDQVAILRKENSALLDRLATLTQPTTPAKPPATACEPPSTTDGKESPDFVGIGIELVRTRELQDIPIPTISVDRSVVQKHIAKWLETQFQPGQGLLQGRALAALGAIPEPVDTVALKAQFLSHQIGAWYVPEEQTLYLAGSGELPVGMEHKENALGLAYGYLFKRFASKLFPPVTAGPPLTLDARLSRDCMLSGDASLTRFLHALKHPETGGGGGVGEDPDDPSRSVPIPNFLRQIELAAFSAGFDFMQSLHSIGEWEQVNAAYTRVPVAGAEVLDSRLYLGETPFMLMPISPDDFKVEGAAPFWTDTLGPMGTVILLRQHAPEPIAADTAKGWANDRLMAYPSESKGRENAVWQTRWRDSNAADAFFSAMRQALLSRYKGAKPVDGAPQGVFKLEANGRTVTLQRTDNGYGVLYVDAADAAFAKAAAAKFAP